MVRAERDRALRDDLLGRYGTGGPDTVVRELRHG
jgi:hypothetical protein